MRGGPVFDNQPDNEQEQDEDEKDQGVDDFDDDRGPRVASPEEGSGWAMNGMGNGIDDFSDEEERAVEGMKIRKGKGIERNLVGTGTGTGRDQRMQSIQPISSSSRIDNDRQQQHQHQMNSSPILDLKPKKSSHHHHHHHHHNPPKLSPPSKDDPFSPPSSPADSRERILPPPTPLRRRGSSLDLTGKIGVSGSMQAGRSGPNGSEGGSGIGRGFFGGGGATTSGSGFGIIKRFSQTSKTLQDDRGRIDQDPQRRDNFLSRIQPTDQNDDADDDGNDDNHPLYTYTDYVVPLQEMTRSMLTTPVSAKSRAPTGNHRDEEKSGESSGRRRNAASVKCDMGSERSDDDDRDRMEMNDYEYDYQRDIADESDLREDGRKTIRARVREDLMKKRTRLTKTKLKMNDEQSMSEDEDQRRRGEVSDNCETPPMKSKTVRARVREGPVNKKTRLPKEDQIENGRQNRRGVTRAAQANPRYLDKTNKENGLGKSTAPAATEALKKATRSVIAPPQAILPNKTLKSKNSEHDRRSRLVKGKGPNADQSVQGARRGLSGPGAMQGIDSTEDEGEDKISDDPLAMEDGNLVDTEIDIGRLIPIPLASSGDIKQKRSKLHPPAKAPIRKQQINQDCSTQPSREALSLNATKSRTGNLTVRERIQTLQELTETHSISTGTDELLLKSDDDAFDLREKEEEEMLRRESARMSKQILSELPSYVSERNKSTRNKFHDESVDVNEVETDPRTTTSASMQSDFIDDAEDDEEYLPNRRKSSSRPSVRPRHVDSEQMDVDNDYNEMEHDSWQDDLQSPLPTQRASALPRLDDLPEMNVDDPDEGDDEHDLTDDGEQSPTPQRRAGSLDDLSLLSLDNSRDVDASRSGDDPFGIKRAQRIDRGEPVELIIRGIHSGALRLCDDLSVKRKRLRLSKPSQIEHNPSQTSNVKQVRSRPGPAIPEETGENITFDEEEDRQEADTDDLPVLEDIFQPQTPPRRTRVRGRGKRNQYQRDETNRFSDDEEERHKENRPPVSEVPNAASQGKNPKRPKQRVVSHVGKKSREKSTAPNCRDKNRDGHTAQSMPAEAEEESSEEQEMMNVDDSVSRNRT